MYVSQKESSANTAQNKSLISSLESIFRTALLLLPWHIEVCIAVTCYSAVSDAPQRSMPSPRGGAGAALSGTCTLAKLHWHRVRWEGWKPGQT